MPRCIDIGEKEITVTKRVFTIEFSEEEIAHVIAALGDTYENADADDYNDGEDSVMKHLPSRLQGTKMNFKTLGALHNDLSKMVL